MIVVSDTSPLLNLACIGEEAILGKLYSQLHVPPEVQAEFHRLRNAAARFARVQMPPFARTVPLQNNALVAALGLDLDRGEAEAIALAVELRADALLIDEHRGRMVAQRLGVPRMGLLGILALAKQRGIVSAVAPLL